MVLALILGALLGWLFPDFSKGLAFLRDIGGRTPADVTGTGAQAAALRDLERVHGRLIAMHLEKTLRSARVVKELGHDL